MMRIKRLSRMTFIAGGLSLVLCAVIATHQQPATQTLPLSGILPIVAPRIVNTGQQINVEIGPVTAHNGTPVGLVLVGAHGPRIYNSTFEAGMARFVIPSEDTYEPGYVALIVAADEARGETSIVLFTRRPELAAFLARAGIGIS